MLYLHTDPNNSNIVTWQYGEVLPELQDVFVLKANGAELDFILRNVFNIPRTNNKVQVWRGDFAQFIYDNIRYDSDVITSSKESEDERQLREGGWKRVPDDLDMFYEVIVEVNRELNPDQILEVGAGLGYAFREVIRGEELSQPTVTCGSKNGKTMLLFSYDSTKTRSDDPDLEKAFELASTYIQKGSPVRRTDRAGAGTKGTKLVQGIGPCKLRYWVR